MFFSILKHLTNSCFKSQEQTRDLDENQIYLKPLFSDESFEEFNSQTYTLEKAIKKGDLLALNTLLKDGTDPNVILKDHDYTPLMLAAEYGQKESVELLIELGADPNLRSTHGHTALTLTANFKPAYNSDHTDIAQLLLDKSANIDVATNFGTNALLFAIIHENVNLTKLVLERGADPNKSLDDNSTALMIAARNGNPEIVKLLLKKGAKLDTRSFNTGYTALMLACAEGHNKVVEDLLIYGANPNILSINKKTPLIVACEKTNANLAQILLNNNAEPNRVGNISPLLLAIQHKSIEITNMLLNAGADPNDPAEQNLTPLMLSIVNNFMYGFYALINHSKLEIDKIRMDSSTALILAVKKGNLEIVKVLIKRNADPYKLDSNGKSALMLAYEEDQDIYNFLLGSGIIPKL